MLFQNLQFEISVYNKAVYYMCSIIENKKNQQQRTESKNNLFFEHLENKILLFILNPYMSD